MTKTKTLTVVVCRGPNCSAAGSGQLMQWCQDLASANLPIHFQASKCTGNCSEAPVVQWNGRYVTEVTPESLTSLLIEDDAL